MQWLSLNLQKTFQSNFLQMIQLKNIFLLFTALILILLCASSCGKRPPLIPLTAHQTPHLVDSGNKVKLLQATERHLDFLHKLPTNTTFFINKTQYPVEYLIESLELFNYLVNTSHSFQKLAQQIPDYFDVFQASGRSRSSGQQMLITAYYEPVLEGSLHRTGQYQWPLYRIPDNLISSSSAKKTRIFRKTQNGTTLPYWTRQEIEENNHLKGYELVYLKDPFDAFTLHVQGSGKISLPDGSIRSIRYAGSNGRPYSSIGKLMVDRGIMVREEVTMDKLKSYIHEHPEERKSILYHNRKYIFFEWAEDNRLPKGSTGVELTPHRSIAIDQETLPRGCIGFLITRLPEISEEGQIQGWKEFNHFVLPQDSGAAIKGAGRVDIFLGNTLKAKQAAGVMQEEGKLYFLLKKAPGDNLK